MDKTRLTTSNNTNHTIHSSTTNNNRFRPASPTIVTIPNDEAHILETDRFLTEHASSNILSDLPRSRNLEEIDENELPFPGFAERVFYCFRQTTPLRYQCLQLITSPWFERVSMFVILLNCITLGMYQPCAHHTGTQATKRCDTPRCIWLQATDYFIFGFFTVEMCIKMTAMGIFGKGSYLAETWNRLDCFIVVSGLVESLIPGDNLSLSAIRTVRVLRPLRAINRVPSMRILVMLLLDTLPMLGNVLLLCFFVFFIFGIVGVQLWKGLLRNRCFLELNTTTIPDHALFDDFPLRPFYIPADHDSFVCSQPHSSGMTKCSEIPKQRKGNLTCELDFHTYSAQLANDPNKPINGCINWNQYYKFCNVSDKNPFSGSISFDNIGLAWVAIFQIISLESWVNIMYYIQDAHSFWDWTYFVCLIVIGSFFMINLCLVVIATQFSETKKRETERMMAERRRFSRSSSTLLSEEPGSCWEETIKYLERLWKHGQKRLKIWWSNRREKRAQEIERRLVKSKSHDKKRSSTAGERKASSVQIQIDSIANSSPSTNSNRIHRPNCRLYQLTESLTVPPHLSSPASIRLLAIDAPAASPELSDIIDSTHPPSPAIDHEKLGDGPGKMMPLTPDFVLKDPRSRLKKSLDVTHMICSDTNTLSSANNVVQNLLVEPASRRSSIHFCECHRQDDIHDERNKDNDDDDEGKEEMPRKKNPSKISRLFERYCLSYLIKIRLLVSKFVASKYFRRIVLSAIVINTLSMGIEYHGQPKSLTNALEYSNVVFTSLFAIEMLLKIIAEGCLKYIKNAYNIFDGVIVVMSVVELQGNSNSGLSVLRTFRLLRVLKLVRFMPTLRRQLVVMLRTMDNVATFFSLLILFIFIFSILGMNLFGCKFCKYIEVKHSKHLEFECSRKNFDSLLWATLTVFQVLTQEDWNEVLYNGMEKTSAWAALYFIALMTFGNYVLFNLLVAILVEGFSSEKGSGASESGSSTDRLTKADPFKTHALFTGDLEVPGNPHEWITDETASGKLSNHENRTSRSKEVKIMNIPKIAISNEDDSSLQIVETHLEPMDTVATPPTPFKSIIKNRSSLPPTPSSTSTTTHSYHTCPTRVDANHANDTFVGSSMRKKSMDYSQISKPRIIDENDTENDVSELSHVDELSKANKLNGEPKIHRRRDTISTTSVLPSNDPSNEHAQPKRSRLRKNRSFTAGNGDRSTVVVLQNSSGNSFIPNMTTPPPPLPYAEKNARDSLTQVPQAERRRRHLNPVRRTHSYRPSSSSSSSTTMRRFIVRDGKLLEQAINTTHPIIKRRSTLDNSSYPMTQMENSSVYGTPRNDESEQYRDATSNSIRLVTDANTNTQVIVNDQSDMQLDLNTGAIRRNSPQAGIFQSLLVRLFGERVYHCLEKQDTYSLYMFSPENRFRKALSWLIVQKSFDYSVLFFIALNCITLAMERPSIPTISFERQFLNISNYVFTVIFAVEMMIKIVASGLICGAHTYLHTGWNVMDGFLVIISVIDLATMNRSGTAAVPITAESDATSRIFSMLRVFRLLRTLRPLRVISRAPGLKLVVQTLLSSLRPIGHIVVICCTFFIIFGILGVQLFKGKFYYCDGSLARNVTTRQQCEELSDHRWKNQQYNFDNLGQALLALFVLSSRDGWVQIMYNGIDAVGVDMQPKRNYHEANLIYFISFLLLVGFFVLNMFVGVVVENFHKCRAEQEREEKARRTAKRAKKIERKRRRMREVPYYAHFSPWRRRLHDVCNSKYFDLIIAAVIGLNVVTMSLEFYLMPPIFELALDYCNYVFTTVFVFESISKIIALGPMRYFRDKWNQLDTMIVVLSIAGIVMEKMKSGHILPINPTLIRVMRVLRIARVLKLLKMAKGIRALLDTVIQALPQVGNLGLLFFLLFFIFAALGVELFGKLECSEERPCTGLDKHAHFKDFGMAFLTLFRIATGDNWNGIMKDTLRQDDPPQVAKNQFMTAIAPIYFVVFVLMAQFVLVNVVVAVLMKKLDESNRMMADDAEIDEEIERQLEADAQDRNYQEQPLLDDNELEFLNDDTMHVFPLTKQLSLPPNFTFHSMCSPSSRRPKNKPIEIIKGSSLSSVVGSTARFITAQMDKSSPEHHNGSDRSSAVRTSTEILYRPDTSVSHRRSNTVPSRGRKPEPTKTVDAPATHLSPTYQRKDSTPGKSPSQPFSPSLLQVQPRRRIRAIDDTDEGDSPSSSTINRDD